MKLLICIIAGVTITIMMILFSPVVPQANATGNFTASENVSIDFWNPADIENAMSNAFQSFVTAWEISMTTIVDDAIQDYIDMIVEQQDDTLNSIFVFILCVLISAAAFWKKEVFLDLMAVIVDIVYGLMFASTQIVKSAGWVEGLIVAIIGTWILFNRVRIEFLAGSARRKARRK